LAYVLILSTVAPWALNVQAGVAHAQQPAPVMPSSVPARVAVDLMVIAASNEPGASDPRLSGQMAALTRTGFQRFSLLDERSGMLADTEEQTMTMAGDRRVRVSLVSHDAVSARVHVELVSAGVKVMDSTITINRNRAFYLRVNGAPGTAVFIPVNVRY
jgi:hypothetical protein